MGTQGFIDSILVNICNGMRCWNMWQDEELKYARGWNVKKYKRRTRPEKCSYGRTYWTVQFHYIGFIRNRVSSIIFIQGSEESKKYRSGTAFLPPSLASKTQHNSLEFLEVSHHPGLKSILFCLAKFLWEACLDKQNGNPVTAGISLIILIRFGLHPVNCNINNHHQSGEQIGKNLPL